MGDLFVECPWCGGGIMIEKINCGIFRHGFIKSTNKQLDPHAKKEVIDEMIAKNNLIGCGGPFKLVNEVTEKCDYI